MALRVSGQNRAGRGRLLPRDLSGLSGSSDRSSGSSRRNFASRRPIVSGGSGCREDQARRRPANAIRAEPRMLTVALPALYAMKAALYLAAKEARLSPTALAAKLGTNEEGDRTVVEPAPNEPRPGAGSRIARHRQIRPRRHRRRGSAVGCVERSETRRVHRYRAMMGVATLSPSYELQRPERRAFRRWVGWANSSSQPARYSGSDLRRTSEGARTRFAAGPAHANHRGFVHVGP